MRSAFITVLVLSACLAAGAADTDPQEATAAIEKAHESTGHQLDVLAKKIDDVLWYQRVGDVAVVEKARIYGPPRWKEENPTGKNAGNPLKFYTYLFTPKGFDGAGRLPLLVLPHGGVHGDFTTYYAHIVRELVAQGYIVVAPEYRGSTGYGRGMYEDIDYGGLEVEDALAARDWAVKNHPRVDADRVGILGWSHGGLITLFSLFHHPDSYACGFAGVPVSDLVQRMGYMTRATATSTRPTTSSTPRPRRTSRSTSAARRCGRSTSSRSPLLIHTNVHDEDVNYIEVEHLIQALTAAGKDFEHEVSDVPGGHSFDRLDTPEAWGYRKKIYAFLARYLKPPSRRCPSASPRGPRGALSKFSDFGFVTVECDLPRRS